MPLLAWGIVGVVVGAAGSEILRTRKPELVEKVEGLAKNFAGLLCRSKSCEQQSQQGQVEKEDEHDEDAFL